MVGAERRRWNRRKEKTLEDLVQANSKYLFVKSQNINQSALHLTLDERYADYKSDFTYACQLIMKLIWIWLT